VFTYAVSVLEHWWPRWIPWKNHWSLTHCQCDARLTIPATGNHRPLSGTKWYCCWQRQKCEPRCRSGVARFQLPHYNLCWPLLPKHLIAVVPYNWLNKGHIMTSLPRPHYNPFVVMVFHRWSTSHGDTSWECPTYPQAGLLWTAGGAEATTRRSAQTLQGRTDAEPEDLWNTTNWAQQRHDCPRILAISLPWCPWRLRGHMCWRHPGELTCS